LNFELPTHVSTFTQDDKFIYEFKEEVEKMTKMKIPKRRNSFSEESIKALIEKKP